MRIAKACLIIFITLFLPGVLVGQVIRQPYEIVVNGSGYMSSSDGVGTFVNIYLNNLSNDTLIYQKRDGKNGIFKLSANACFGVDTYGFEGKQNQMDTIPPHRSQKIRLLLKTKKRPVNNVAFVVTMTLHKEAKGGRQKVINIADNTTLFYRKGRPFWGPDAIETANKKRDLILPDKNIYLLTADDRKVYKLIADKANITLPNDTNVYVPKTSKYQTCKTVTVPVILQNASDKTLKFWSMSCSWADSYSSNNKHIFCALQPCEKNVSTVISIAPHSVYKRYLNVVYDNNVRKGMKYKLSFSLIKATEKNLQTWAFPVHEYVGLNKISTDDISVR